MQRFRFTLDAVRDLRREGETVAMQQLATQLARHEQARGAAAVSAERRRLAEERLRHPSGPAALLVQADREREAATSRAAQADGVVREGARLVEQARDGLVEARRALEAMERLEQRQRAEHRRRALAEEEREVGEVVEARAARLAARDAQRRRETTR